MGTELLEHPPEAVADAPSLQTEKQNKKRRHRKAPIPPNPQDPAPNPVGQNVRAKAFRKGMLRLVKKDSVVNLVLVVFVSAVALIFLLSLFQSGMGNFTISLARADMYQYGIELAADPDFVSATSRLEASAIEGATNISATDLPEDLNNTDGSHNGKNYIAYTFYVRNNGTADLNYRYQIDITDVTRNLDSAIRVGLYYNGGDRQIFAKKAQSGDPEPGTVTFATDRVIDGGAIMDMKVKSVDKYTIVIWIEGDDPDCTDELLGGVIKMQMGIEVIENEG